jgi:hypothetical protein
MNGYEATGDEKDGFKSVYDWFVANREGIEKSMELQEAL